MMVRRDALEKVKGFDEEFFLYGEDLDLCFRVQQAGWKVYFTPATQIIHFKGASAGKVPFSSRKAFYQAMFLFSRKHITMHRSFLPKSLLYSGIFLNACFGVFRLILSNLPAVFLDLFILNTGLWITMTLWFRWVHLGSPYGDPDELLFSLHLGLSFVWIFTLAAMGAYRNRQRWVFQGLRACALSSSLSLAMVYLIKQIAFSRAAFLMTSVGCTLLIPTWRWVIDKIGAAGGLAPPFRVLIVGTGDQIHLTLKTLKKQRPIKKAGYLTNEPEAQIEGAENFGTPDRIPEIVKREEIDEVIVFENEISYTRLIDAIALSASHRPLIRLASLAEDGRLLLADFAASPLTRL
jgi:hypothetical protein